MVGVELDPTTAAIAARAVPRRRQIRTESFADTRAARRHVRPGRSATSRSPTCALHDPRHNRGRPLASTTTSSSSRCALTAPRRARRGDHLPLHAGRRATRPRAARWPSSPTWSAPSGCRAARTSAPPAPTSSPTCWSSAAASPTATPAVDRLGARPRARSTIDGQEVRVNAWFAEHPERRAGSCAVGRGQYSAAELQVAADRRVARPAALRAPGHGRRRRRAQRGLRHAADRRRRRRRAGRAGARRPGLEDGHIVVDADGCFRQVVDGAAAADGRCRARQAASCGRCWGCATRPPRCSSAEAAHARRHRDASTGCAPSCSAATTPTPARYGPINRFTLRRTGRVDRRPASRDGARRPRRHGGFAHRPVRAARARAGALRRRTTQTARQADDLRRARGRPPHAVARRRHPRRRARDLPGHPRPRRPRPRSPQLLGADEADARAGLGRAGVRRPRPPARWSPPPEYLSGNVRDKLAAARAAAEHDPTLEVNVAALTEVVPADLAPEDIAARLGAPWIDADTTQQFLREMLDDPTSSSSTPAARSGASRGDDALGRRDQHVGHRAGCRRRRLATAAARAAPGQVTDEVDADGRRVVNPAETAAAAGEGRSAHERFGDWVWEDPERATGCWPSTTTLQRAGPAQLRPRRRA